MPRSTAAYDAEDWFYRLTTMVQMIGVFNGVMIVGYLIMRVARITQWLRAAAQDPARRPYTYLVREFDPLRSGGSGFDGDGPADPRCGRCPWEGMH